MIPHLKTDTETQRDSNSPEVTELGPAMAELCHAGHQRTYGETQCKAGPPFLHTYLCHTRREAAGAFMAQVFSEHTLSEQKYSFPSV